jgi:hypothetical protein
MIKACSNDVQALLALLPMAEDQTQIEAIHFYAMMASDAKTAVAFVESLGASERIKLRAKFRQACASKDSKGSSLYAKAYFETYGGQLWRMVQAKHLTTQEAVQFYELVLKNVALTEETKDRLGAIKGELLKLKDL